MPTYIITCPVCKQRYKATKIPSTPQPFVCKKCGYSAPLNSVLNKDLPSQLVTNSEAVNLRSSANPNVLPKTVPGTKVRAGTALEVKAYLTVVGNGVKFVLVPGVYILGRKSSDSMATLQIAPDITISRQHARLTVQSVGGKVMAQIIGLKNDNPVIINGKALPAGQAQTLRSGDRLQFGTTNIVYTV